MKINLRWLIVAAIFVLALALMGARYQEGLLAYYNASPPTYTNGQQVALQTDASGNLNIIQPAATPWTNNGAAITTAVAVTTSATQGLTSFEATNTSASTNYYIEFFNTNPTLGTTAPIKWMIVPPGPSGIVRSYSYPVKCTSLYVAFVTSMGGSTAAPASTCYASVDVK